MALKVRRNLGQQNPGLLLPFPPKPRGMHYNVYMKKRLIALRREREILFEDLEGIINGGL